MASAIRIGVLAEELLDHPVVEPIKLGLVLLLLTLTNVQHEDNGTLYRDHRRTSGRPYDEITKMLTQINFKISLAMGHL